MATFAMYNENLKAVNDSDILYSQYLAVNQAFESNIYNMETRLDDLVLPNSAFRLTNKKDLLLGEVLFGVSYTGILVKIATNYDSF